MKSNKYTLLLKLQNLEKVFSIISLPANKKRGLIESVLLLAVSRIIDKNKQSNLDIQKIAGSKALSDDLTLLIEKLDDSIKNDFIQDVSELLDEYVKQVSEAVSTAKKEEIQNCWKMPS